MSKKLTTIKEYLENRIVELEQYKEEVRIDDWPEAGALSASIRELQQALKVYNQQCEEILSAVGITQERINEHVGYTESQCIKFAKWVGDNYSPMGQGVWKKDETDMVYNTEEVYTEYEITEERDQSSTEEGTGTSS